MAAKISSGLARKLCLSFLPRNDVNIFVRRGPGVADQQVDPVEQLQQELGVAHELIEPTKVRRFVSGEKLDCFIRCNFYFYLFLVTMVHFTKLINALKFATDRFQVFLFKKTSRISLQTFKEK